MKKRDLLLILGLVVLACALLLAGLAKRGRFSLPSAQTAAESPDPAAQAEASPSLGGEYSEAVRQAVAAYFEEYPAESYLVLATSSGLHTPIPLNGDNEFRLTQSDGSENVVHIGKNSFYMASSNCDNQNCIGQGEVTLANRETRVLFNMVICLPHNLSLQLLDRAETEELLAELYASAEAEGASFGAESDAS